MAQVGQGVSVRRLVDTNIVLRYLLGDDNVASENARKIVSGGCTLLPEVCCEAVYVMAGVYGMTRSEICGWMTGFIDEVSCQEADVLKTALSIFKKRVKLDFVDAILAAYRQVRGDAVETFDKKLNVTLRRIEETGSVD